MTTAEAHILELLKKRGIDPDQVAPAGPRFVQNPLRLIQGFLDGLRPEQTGTITEWADANRYLSSEGAKESGKYSSERTPYLREIMNALSPSSPVQYVVFMKGSQIGATEAAVNMIGCYMDWFRCPMMYYMPTDTDMRKASQVRLDPMIEHCPTLKAKVHTRKSRSSRNSALMKSGTGFILTMAGGNSPNAFASMAGRVIVVDEYDRYPSNVGNEGSPLGLIEARTSTFGAQRKIFVLSTPTTAASKIAALFEMTDQRRYHVPCPHCLELQVLEWENFEYKRLGEDNYHCAAYCIHCAAEIQETHKTWMLENGKWISTNPDLESSTKRGYHLSALYSPIGWLSWGEIAAKHDKAYNLSNDANLQTTFENTILGMTYSENQERPAWDELKARSGKYLRNKLPEFSREAAPGKPMFMTCGCDVQKDRIELSIVAWGIGSESWRVDYRVFHGKTEDATDPCWEGLAGVMRETWTVSGLRMPIALTALDCNYQTKIVTKVVQLLQNRGFRIIPVIGRDNQILSLHQGPGMHETPDGKRYGTPLFFVGVSNLKHQLYGFLRLKPYPDGTYPAGFCHFPDYGDDYFQSLTAEAIQVITDSKGYPKEQWVKIHPRNEALDCDIYAAAAADYNEMRNYTAAQMDKFRGQAWIVRENLREKSAGQTTAAKPKKPKRNLYDRSDIY